MKELLQQIPQRVQELREILDITQEEMAKKLNISIDEYIEYETAKKDISISMLYAIASELNVDLTVLLTGESPKMSSQSVVRNGEGVSVERYEGYSFSSLAFNYKAREMEPLLVTLAPGKSPAMVSHAGQEFNYCVKGTVRVVVGAREHILYPGDSIYFDAQVPHGQSAVNEESQFLTVLNEPFKLKSK